MNINEKLNEVNTFVSYVKTCKEAMRQALIGQEQDIPVEATLDNYADYIAAIEGGGGVIVYTVQYVDWDGAVLKSQNVLPGGTVLKPADPTREYYAFTGWDGDSEVVNEDMTITAQYEYAPNTVVFLDYQGKIISTQNVPTGSDAVPPSVDWDNVVLNSWSDYTDIQGSRVILPSFNVKDSKLYLTITLDETTGLTPDFYFWVSSGILSIEWGEGTTWLASYTTNYAFTYPDYGTYLITLTSTGSASLGFAPSGLGGWKAAFSGTYAKAIKKVRAGSGAVRIGWSAFMGNTGFDDIAIDAMSAGNGSRTFDNCTSITSLLLPTSLTTLGSATFSNCSNLKTIILQGSSIVTLLATSALGGCHPDLKIYVPEDLVDGYKAATNWSYLQDKIHKINDLAIYGN